MAVAATIFASVARPQVFDSHGLGLTDSVGRSAVPQLPSVAPSPPSVQRVPDGGPTQDQLRTPANEATYARALNQAYEALRQGDLEAAARHAREASAADPASETPVRIQADALARLGRRDQALAVADAFVGRGEASGELLAQRGYLRRAVGDPTGAANDMAAALAKGGLSAEQVTNLTKALEEARSAILAAQSNQIQVALDRAYRALAAGDRAQAIASAREAQQLDPNAEVPVRLVIDALIAEGRGDEALAEADRAIAAMDASGYLLAQRGYLRRGRGDRAGAIADFQRALGKTDLSPAQRQNIEAAIAEARRVAATAPARPAPDPVNRLLDQAYRALRENDTPKAIRLAEEARRLRPDAEIPLRVLIDALIKAGNKKRALALANGWRAADASGLFLAQRGYLRYDAGDDAGAVADFTLALKRSGSATAAQRTQWRRALLAAEVRMAEKAGDFARAISLLTAHLRQSPRDADVWYMLAGLLSRQKQDAAALQAYGEGLRLAPRGDRYLDAGFAAARARHAIASNYLRRGLDAVDAGDPTVAYVQAKNRDVIRAQIAESDASIRLTLGGLGIIGRPISVGGSKMEGGFDATVRFDGRYLPAVPGLEAFTRGYASQDETRFREDYVAAGMRWRPFNDVNFAMAAEVQRRFEPKELTQLALSYGYGLGGFNFPIEAGHRPFWNFSAFGTYRFGEKRYLQDFVAGLGYVFDHVAPVRLEWGPLVTAVAAYDSADARPWASGIGPGLIARFWLGGDHYRSHDATLTFQGGYLAPLGGLSRQEGYYARATLTLQPPPLGDGILTPPPAWDWSLKN